VILALIKITIHHCTVILLSDAMQTCCSL